MEEEVLLGRCLSTDIQLLETFSEPFSSTKTPFISITPKLDSLFNDELTVDRSELVDANKLLKALIDFGLEPTELQLTELQHKLVVNSNNFVRFGDFVDCAREIFHDELLERLSLSTNLSSMLQTKNRGCLDVHSLRRENAVLVKEITRLKNHVQEIESACSRIEDELVKVRKELQCRIECTRELRRQLEIEVMTKQAALAEIDHSRPSPREQKLVSASSQTSPLKVGIFSACEIRELASLKREIGDLKTSNAAFKAVSHRLLNFLEGMQNSLSGVLQEPSNKVGRSFSLYRNATELGRLQNAPLRTRGAVVRAASVSSPLKTDAIRENMRHGDYGTLLELVKETKYIISATKEVLHEESLTKVPKSSCTEADDDKISWSAKKMSKNPFRNLPSTTVVTIMSRV